MRRVLMVLLMLSMAGSAMAAVTTANIGTAKDPGIPYVNPGGRITGDTIGDPFIIPTSLPFLATGTTVGFNNDYDEVCPYSGSTAPDVVYKYVAEPGHIELIIDLCYSSYDTKVYVYDSTDLVTPIACNDDYYFTTPCFTYASYLGNVPITAGHTYYIVVDGYGGASGAYQLEVSCFDCFWSGACCAAQGTCSITLPQSCAGTWQGDHTVCVPNPCPQPPPPPPIPCPMGSLIEGEPTCQDNYIDNYNGGCNSTPVIWQALAPQADGCAVMCGKSCTYLLGGASNRDTDRYLSDAAGGNVTATVTAAFPVMIALFYADIADCSAIQYTYALGAEYVPTSVSYSITAGNQVGFFVANQSFTGYPAEARYILDVCGIQDPPPPPGACCDSAGACIVTTPENCAFMGGTFQGDPTCTPTTCIPVPTERKSWGAVKNLYR